MTSPDSTELLDCLANHASYQDRETVSSSPEIDQGEGSSGTVFMLSLARPKRLSDLTGVCYHSRYRNGRLAGYGMEGPPRPRVN